MSVDTKIYACLHAHSAHPDGIYSPWHRLVPERQQRKLCRKDFYIANHDVVCYNINECFWDKENTTYE